MCIAMIVFAKRVTRYELLSLIFVMIIVSVRLNSVFNYTFCKNWNSPFIRIDVNILKCCVILFSCNQKGCKTKHCIQQSIICYNIPSLAARTNKGNEDIWNYLLKHEQRCRLVDQSNVSAAVKAKQNQFL